MWNITLHMSPRCLNTKDDKKDSLGLRKAPPARKFFYVHPGYNILLADIYRERTYLSPTTENLSDLGFDLFRSLMVKCDGASGLTIYDFIFMFNDNICPNLRMYICTSICTTCSSFT